MIRILPAPDHVAAFRVLGTMTVDDYQLAIDEIEAKLNTHDRINVYSDISEFSDITADTIAKRLTYGLSKLGELHRFARSAAISDKQWVRAWVDFVKRFLPASVEVRVFDPAQRDAAMAWVSEIPPA